MGVWSNLDLWMCGQNATLLGNLFSTTNLRTKKSETGRNGTDCFLMRERTALCTAGFPHSARSNQFQHTTSLFPFLLCPQQPPPPLPQSSRHVSPRRSRLPRTSTLCNKTFFLKNRLWLPSDAARSERPKQAARTRWHVSQAHLERPRIKRCPIFRLCRLAQRKLFLRGGQPL